jgi:hypothetical protein
VPTVVTRQRRAVRAATFGTTLTVTAVLAHALAGGMVPAIGVIAGAAAVVCLLGWLLSGRDRSPLVLAATALTVQAALHVSFSLAMPGPMSMSSLLCGRSAAGSPRVDTALMRSRITPAATSATGHQMLLMMAAHAAGAVVVLLALRSAESLVGVIAGLLTAVLLQALPAVAIPVAHRVRAVRRVRRLRPTLLFVSSPRRGPPVLALS